MERFKLLTDAELLRIDQASRALLWEVGVEVTDSRAREYYAKAGAVVDNVTNMVRIPDWLITETIKKCSSYVRLYDRRGSQPMVIGGDDVYFGTVGMASNVLDINTDQHRGALKQDLIDIIQLADVLDPPAFIDVLGTPFDFPTAVFDLLETRELLLNTTKHFVAEAQNAVNCKKTFEMAAEVAGGMDKLVAEPFFTIIVTLTSPLHFRQDVADLIIETSLAGMPLLIESGPMAGGTGPASLAGTLICANAEILNSFVLAKAVNPNVPLIYASWARTFDMRVAACCHGGPEFAMLRAATTQLAKFYGLPSSGGSTLSDSKSIDVQMGMEKMGTGLLPALARTNMLFGMGLLADENSMSLEALIIDSEIARWIERVLRGIDVSKATCELGVFKEVGPGGNFVSCENTRNYYKVEQFIPTVMDRGYLALDKDPMDKNIRKRAKALYPKLMKNFNKPEVSDAVVKRIDDIIAR